MDFPLLLSKAQMRPRIAGRIRQATHLIYWRHMDVFNHIFA